MTTAVRSTLSRACTASILTALAIAHGGCASAPPRSPASVADGEAAEEFAQNFLDHRREAISTIHAGLELEWTSPVLEAQTSCRASLVFRAPELLRVRGTSAAFFTIFELVADADTIRFDVPRERLLVQGAREDAAWSQFPLDPDLVSIALTAHPDLLGVSGRPLVEARGEFGDSLVAIGPGGVMEFDAKSGMPKSFARAGDLAARIEWGDWTRIDGTDWPLRIDMTWPVSEERLVAKFGRVQFGRSVREESFSEGPDEPRLTLEPDEGLERWREAFRAVGEADTSED